MSAVTPQALMVCQHGMSPPETLCDLGGNLYEISSDLDFVAGAFQTQVCFGSFNSTIEELTECMPWPIDNPSEQVGGRCVRDR